MGAPDKCLYVLSYAGGENSMEIDSAASTLGKINRKGFSGRVLPARHIPC